MFNDKIAALTFDDGPNTVTTPQVLDILEKYGVPASFFVCGKNIDPESGEVMKRAVRLGCEIQNHSRNHSDMTKMTEKEIRAEIDYTSDRIEEAVGMRPRFFRPPYIAVNELMHRSTDLTFICGIGAEDWNDEVSAEERYRRIMENLTDGMVILLHDMQGNSETVKAVDMLIPALKEQGYRLVAISKLFEEKGVAPKRGEMYTVV